MTTSPSSSSGTSSSMTASVAGPALTMIMMRRGRASAATNSSVVTVRTKSPSVPCAASRASVRSWVRLCATTWWPCRAKFRARLAPIVASPVTPICSLMAGHRAGIRGAAAASVTPLLGTLRGSVETELPAQLGHVPGRLDVVGGLLDAPIGVDDEGRADHAHRLLAVELLRAVRAVGGEHLLVGVGDQRDAEVLLLPEPHQLLRRV